MMEPPQHAVYSSLEDLVNAANGHAVVQGYKLVVVRSKTNAQGQKTWVHLACDRHGMLVHPPAYLRVVVYSILTESKARRGTLTT